MEIQALAEYIDDKFDLFEEAPAIPSNDDEAYKVLLNALSFRITEMIDADFEGLMNLLYRVDVDENELKRRLAGEEAFDPARVMASMVIERQLQKMKSRQKSQSESPDWEFDI